MDNDTTLNSPAVDEAAGPGPVIAPRPCSQCGSALSVGVNWYPAHAKTKRYICKACATKARKKVRAAKRAEGTQETGSEPGIPVPRPSELPPLPPMPEAVEPALAVGVGGVSEDRLAQLVSAVEDLNETAEKFAKMLAQVLMAAGPLLRHFIDAQNRLAVLQEKVLSIQLLRVEGAVSGGAQAPVPASRPAAAAPATPPGPAADSTVHGAGSLLSGASRRAAAPTPTPVEETDELTDLADEAEGK